MYVFVYSICIELLLLGKNSYIPSEDSLYSYLNIIIHLAQFGLVFLFLFFENRDSLRFDKAKIKYYFYAVIIGLLSPLIQIFLGVIYYMEMPPISTTPNFEINKSINLANISSIIVVPFTEEFFFRGYIQKKLSNKYKMVISIIITSILFGLAHFKFSSFFIENYFFNVHQIYITFFFSIIAGLIYYKSKSIGPVILLHILWNLITILLK